MARIASSSTTDSFLKVANVTKSRQTQRTTTCVLFKLMKIAYSDKIIVNSSVQEEIISSEQWCDHRKCDSP